MGSQELLLMAQRAMDILLAGSILLGWTLGMPSPGGNEECCSEKTVGDIRYTLIGSDNSGVALGLNCLSNCIYARDDDSPAKYCFRPGNLEVKCEDDMELTPPTPSPGTTEGEGPGGIETTVGETDGPPPPLPGGSTNGEGPSPPPGGIETTAGETDGPPPPLPGGSTDGEGPSPPPIGIETTAGETDGPPPPLPGGSTEGEGATPPPGGIETTVAPPGESTAAPGTSKTVVWPLLTSPVTGGYKYTKVFGLGIFAENSISDAKFQHLASVFAEWLDNDEDGCFDNPTLLTKWLALKPLPVTSAFKSDQSIPSDDFPVKGFKVASAVYDNELLPNCSGTAATVNCADATLEEVLHLVTAEGYTQLNSSVFATESTANSKLTLAMDVARGGKFTTIPSPYPTGAWYTYNDASCKYGCQATEYIYWGISAYVGALAGRKAGITDEWDFATRAELKAGDVKLTAIIEDTSSYKLPKISPDGKYKGPLTCASGTNHGGT